MAKKRACIYAIGFGLAFAGCINTPDTLVPASKIAASAKIIQTHPQSVHLIERETGLILATTGEPNGADYKAAERRFELIESGQWDEVNRAYASAIAENVSLKTKLNNADRDKERALAAERLMLATRFSCGVGAFLSVFGIAMFYASSQLGLRKISGVKVVGFGVGFLTLPFVLNSVQFGVLLWVMIASVILYLGYLFWKTIRAE